MTSLIEDQLLKIKKLKQLTVNVWEITLGDAKMTPTPGQFVQLKIPSSEQAFFLRRPLSIADYDSQKKELKLIYKIMGEGTAYLAKTLTVGAQLNILGPLGNGFSFKKEKKKKEEPILVLGGGVGTPPLYYLTKQLLTAKQKVVVILGFNSQEEIFYQKEFEQLGAPVAITTLDGGQGIKGFVTDAILEKKFKVNDYYACGPLPMLNALVKKYPIQGQLSYEARMACGFGACMGCTCKTRGKNEAIIWKRICHEGPVLRSEEIILEEKN